MGKTAWTNKFSKVQSLTHSYWLSSGWRPTQKGMLACWQKTAYDRERNRKTGIISLATTEYCRVLLQTQIKLLTPVAAWEQFFISLVWLIYNKQNHTFKKNPITRQID